MNDQINIRVPGFCQAPNQLVDATESGTIESIRDLRAYLLLWRIGHGRPDGCFASAENLSKRLHLKREHLAQSLRRLESAGWLTRHERPGQTTVYRVHIEPAPPPTGETPLQGGTPHKGEAPYPPQGVPTLPPTGGTNQYQENNNTEQEEPPLRGVQGGKGKNKPKADPFRLKRLPPDAVPLELLECADLLTEFWAVKKGTRSTPVFSRVCNKLMAWSASERQEALERAISSGWGDVFQPQAQQPSRAPWAPPETRHPASRVFTAAHGFDDEPVTNPILKGVL